MLTSVYLFTNAMGNQETAFLQPHNHTTPRNSNRPHSILDPGKRTDNQFKEFVLSKGVGEDLYEERREIFMDEAGEDGQIDRAEFKSYMKKYHGKKNWKKIKQLTPLVFKAFDTDGDEVILYPSHNTFNLGRGK